MATTKWTVAGPRLAGGSFLLLAATLFAGPPAPDAGATASPSGGAPAVAARVTPSASLKEMKRRRYEAFRKGASPAARDAGMGQVRAWLGDDATIADACGVFVEESPALRELVLGTLHESAKESGATALAFLACFGESRATRAGAIARLTGADGSPSAADGPRSGADGARSAADGGPWRGARAGKVEGVAGVVRAALASGSAPALAGGAELADALDILEAIPWLIEAQAPAAGAGTPGDTGGPRAWIFVGQQRAYVANLTPVVSESAAAFQPEIDVANEGVLLVVGDATVTTVSVPVTTRLASLAGRHWGSDLAPLGSDVAAWRAWYKDSFLPARAARTGP